MSAINSPGACLSLDNKVAQLSDFPSLDILVLWKIWARLFSPEHMSTEHLKSVLLWLAPRRLGELFWWAWLPSLRSSLQFPLPQKARVRKMVLFLTKWGMSTSLSEGPGFSHACLLLIWWGPHRTQATNFKTQEASGEGSVSFPSNFNEAKCLPFGKPLL